MPSTLFPLLLALSAAASDAPPGAELVLAGGALRTCSDLAPSACIEPPARPGARTPPRYLVDDGGASRALDPRLWESRPEAPGRDALLRLLSSARGAGALDGRAIEARFEAVCLAPCRGGADRPWHHLLDDERAALLSALEVPQGTPEARPREQAYLDKNKDPAGTDVLRSFVEAARRRAGDQAPRIAVVTASAIDPMDPVDFYFDAFRQLGAQAEWWPLDAALRDAIAAGDCRQLDTLRQRVLGQSGRDRIYADLGALQWRACLDPERLATLPTRVQGVFFAGGDQWRHRRAFFADDGRALPWLESLRDAHARGEVVVGGTSAGTAVQAGAAMVSNGTPRQALRAGAFARPPMDPGCDRAGRCAGGLPEDTLTYWPDGGLGLLPGWTLDTHFSERGRELRLLRLMHDANAALGAGVDETSALHFSREGDGWRVRALGAHGGWVFERLEPAGATLRARVHYLAPGASLVFGESEARVAVDEASPAEKHVAAHGAAGNGRKVDAHDPTGDDQDTQAPTEALPDDALEDGALRAAAMRLAAGEDRVVLPAGNGRATLSRTADTRAWHQAGARAGASHLILEWKPEP